MPQAPRYESRVYTRASLDYIKSHPLQTAWRVFAKLFKFWNPHYGDQVLIYLLFWVAFIRLVKSRRPLNPGVLWLVSMPFMFMLIHAAFYVQVRYVIPALPCIAVVAGAGLAGWKPGPTGAAGSDADITSRQTGDASRRSTQGTPDSSSSQAGGGRSNR